MKNLNLYLGVVMLIINTSILLAQESCNCKDGSELGNLNVLFCENFEKYTLNTPFPPFTNTPWSAVSLPAPFFSVGKNPENTPSQALHVKESNLTGILRLKLGNKSAGKYRISWQMYVPNNKIAQYSFQQNESALSGRQLYYVTFTNRGFGFVKIGKDTTSRFPYFSNAWNKIVQIIDIDNDNIELWINNEFVDMWKFKLSFDSQNNIDTLNKTLGAVNYLSIPNAEYYVDNICIQEPSGNGMPINPVCLKNGRSIIQSGLYTQNEVSKENCPQICDFAGVNTLNSLKVNEIIRETKFSQFSYINKKSILPNTIITNESLKDIFPLLTRRQLRGQVYSFNGKRINSAEISIDLNAIFWDKLAVVVFDCTASQVLIKISNFKGKPITFYANENKDYILMVFAKEPLSYKIRLGINYSTAFGGCMGNYCPPCEIISDELNKFSNLNNQFVSTSSGFHGFLPEIIPDYLGGEKVYQFTNEVTSNVEISIQSLNEKAILYLTGSRCSENLLAYDSTGGNKTANISMQLSAGAYHIIVDQLRLNANAPFSISIVKTPVAKALKSALQNCPTLGQVHTVSIRGAPLLLDGDALTLQDRIYLINPRNARSLESDAFNWNGNQLQFNLYPDDPKDSLSCGYSENEKIQFAIIRGNSIYAVTPIFQPEDGSQITARDVFKKEGKSLIIGFSTGLRIDKLSFQSLPRLGAYDDQFSTLINSTTTWKLERQTTNSISWLTFTPEIGIETTEVKFAIKANTSTNARSETLFLVNPAGFYQPMVIYQPGCIGPSVNAGNEVEVCAGSPFSLRASGNGDIISWEGMDHNPSSVYSGTATQSGIFTAYALKNGCKATDEVNLTVHPKPAGDLKVFNPGKINRGSISPNLSGGTPPYSYTWTKDGVFFSNADSLTELSTGTYALIVSDNNKCSENFGPVNISTTSVPSFVLKDHLEVYPNPVSKTLNLDFKLPQASPFEIVLLDALGRKIWSKKPQIYYRDHLSIDVSSYPKGFYWIQLRSHWGNLVQKIVRQ